ncbi:hypothetical protein RJ639_020912 [Escallonia herrerae]|uniref:Phytochrome n=1 Tax=Escallonia herrerae TaxID=1293975 RepID=A0AA88V887_9ASTE|nr:hypothetical protein RJ639_020912 [Escallonia herrerae]
MKDFLFWFRSHTAKEVKWGGAKHHPEDKDDGGRIDPRASFRAFLEVAKSRSLPWEVSEINAIHSLQLIMRDSFQEIEDSGPKQVVESRQNDSAMQGLTELSSVAFEMVRLIETAMAPIFGVDSSGLINGWNAKMAQLIGLHQNEAMGKSLVNEVVHVSSREVVESLLSRALQGVEDTNVELKLQKFGINQENSIIYIMANTCTSRDYANNVVGVCFVGQDVTSEKVVMDKFIRLQGDYKAIVHSLNPLIPPIFASDENACCSEWNVALEKLTGWMRHEIIGKMLPGEVFGGFCQLKGQETLTKFMILLYRAISGHDTMKLPFGFFDRKGTFVEVLLTANKRIDEVGNVAGCFCFLQTIAPNQQQTLGDRQENSDSLELNVEEFLLENLIDAIVSQVMTALKEKKLQLLHEIPDHIKTLSLYGDQIRLQLVLSDFLLNIVHNAPSPDGWVEIKVIPGLKLIQDGNEVIHLQFRMTHPGQGFPSALLEDMFGGKSQWTTQEGLALNFSRKLLNMMNGHVNYVRDNDKCYFLVDLEVKTRK